jgi:Zn-finger nucleic acid-binding protein
MTAKNPANAIRCPSCKEPMRVMDLERHDHGRVQIELCFTCSGFWFDRMASVELAPVAVIELFKQVHTHGEVQRQPLAGRLDCPRCADQLVLSFDLVKSGRFSYFRCLRGDGRFTPFYQFLREKQFVRTLTPAELREVRVQVRQVTCSQCGAPIDLEHSNECKYCHAAVSLLDPDAVEKAIRMWSQAESRRHVLPTIPGVKDALSRLQQQPALPALPRLGSLADLPSAHAPGAAGFALGFDLVALGIAALGALFTDS